MFNTSTESEERDHVKNQVMPAYMKKSGRNYPLVITVDQDLVNLKRISFKKRRIGKTLIRNDACYLVNQI
jgi:hypothetical protein